MKLDKLLYCRNCGSTEIAVECVVVQREDGELEVTSACDKGHCCNACGSEDICEREDGENPSPDITAANHGSIWIVNPLTPAGRDWLAENLSEDAQRWGEEGYVVETRYLGPLLDGAAGDGLAVA